MVKVKDTQSFIERARELHGDKYDYSQTQYVSAKRPIEIICKRCGEKFRLACASCHYGAKRCGCRSCNKEESLIKKGSAKHCSECGARRKYASGNTKCRECVALGSDEWVDALCKSATRLKRKVKVRAIDGWHRWAKSKRCILANRPRSTGRNKGSPTALEGWDDWLTKNQSKTFRKAEDEWTKRLRHWAWALSDRVKKQAEKNLDR